MSNVSSNVLLTYDSNLELHSDSSDFEGIQSPVVTGKKGKHKFHMKKLYPKRNPHLQRCNSNDYVLSEDTSTEMWERQETSLNQYEETVGEIKVRKSYKNKKYKTLDSGDQIVTIKSKRSLIRHKVMPCLSSMFGRPSNNVKQMSIIKENQAENVNIDNGCQASVNREHKIRKSTIRQPCYAVQPVYAFEGNVHSKQTPLQHTKIVREPLSPRETFRYDNSNMSNSLTSSTEDDRTRRFIKTKKSKRNKTFLNDYSPGYEGSDPKCNIQQQYPSISLSNSPYDIYTTPCQYQGTYKRCSPLPSDCSSDLPGTCSGFWDYLFNKINMKYQGNLGKPCRCNDINTNTTIVTHCCAPTCEKNNNPQYASAPPQAYQSQTPYKQDSCSCCASFHARPPAIVNETQTTPSPILPVTVPLPAPLPAPPPNKKQEEVKVTCKCYSKKYSNGAAPPPAAVVPKSTGSMTMADIPRPCQVPHDEITGNLTQKYRGEILCIHNPPCVLINGCLNLPPPKEETTMNMYPVATNGNSIKSGFQLGQVSKRQKSAQYCLPTIDKQQGQIADESCQYLPPSKENVFENDKLNESCQYQIPEKLKEQMMVTDESCQYLLESNVRKQNMSTNESCQYRVSTFEIPKQQKMANDSCQYRMPSYNSPQDQIPTNDKLPYRVSPFEIPKQQMMTNQSGQYSVQPFETKTNDICQYGPSPFATPKNQSSQRYKLSAFEAEKQPVTANESCQYWVSHTETQKPHMAANESCQYIESPAENNSNKESEPIIELKPAKVKKEKLVQSICNHYPPCEVVRTCRKPKYDPKLQNSCVHVPMCEKVPLCLMELKARNRAVTSCPHKPKCAEVPICTRNYIVLTAKEEAGTQVRPKTKMVCRHEPPCIMIPRCLARACDGCIPCDAIPDCVHQPMCEMIPACCRKSAKEMAPATLEGGVRKVSKVPVYYENKFLRMMHLKRSCK
ncbi:uncharacterized protein LOC124635428 [Helicoverpa zea]|uniref:uncharacterized protein LOC124635428 n=1 Tax=Helicoverpa zea TaxID=7113 RepID=UPI001F571AA0|nr:uncharacterized protein LOC124635428 [Helicoverpa zea]